MNPASRPRASSKFVPGSTSPFTMELMSMVMNMMVTRERKRRSARGTQNWRLRIHPFDPSCRVCLLPGALPFSGSVRRSIVDANSNAPTLNGNHEQNS
ncbi:hypothetical protein CDL15_Pgr000702 [Punica granatum]|uniref:Uncharacterized protein n=1 Tax=Punica granatum TaxID=22663 RepID=A0A218W4M0_PUNGR|nr:hypothetical protein CDL15_Pgr000702 [Punica granatum]